jgi:hypothetical protein
VARRTDPRDRLLLFVDALDEAKDPTRAVGFLPRTLPRNTFVIVSTRPPHREDSDHLAGLRSAGAEVYPLRAEDPNNLHDVEMYLGKQLHDRATEEEVKALTDITGGIFLLARLLAEDVRAGKLSAAEALQQSGSWAALPPSRRLFGYYDVSWQRACAGENPESLATFAALMAAAFTWISEEQLGQILSWHERKVLKRTEPRWTMDRLPAILRRLTWFVERAGSTDGADGALYQIRHQSVRDFLLAPNGKVRPGGLRQMHAAAGNYYRARARKRGWDWVDPYGRFFAVRHLLAAGDRENANRAAELLADLEYLQGTLGEESPESAGKGEPVPKAGSD